MSTLQQLTRFVGSLAVFSFLLIFDTAYAIQIEFSDLNIVFYNIPNIFYDTATISAWSDTHNERTTSYYQNNPSISDMSSSVKLSSISSAVDDTSQMPYIVLGFTHTLDFDTTESFDFDPFSLVSDPFNSAKSQEAYVVMLREEAVFFFNTKGISGIFRTGENIPNSATFSPTHNPTVSKKPSSTEPTKNPTAIPTYTPTIQPITAQPTTYRPTIRPTTQPTISKEPTTPPTIVPSHSPSMQPTSTRPTTGTPHAPTNQPITHEPTQKPTSRPSTDTPTSKVPTVKPNTDMPIAPFKEILSELGMTLQGVSYAKFSAQDRSMWEAATTSHVKSYYEENESTLKVYDVRVGTQIKSAFSALQQSNETNNLQSSSDTATTIIYNIELGYETGAVSLSPEEIASKPFQSDDMGGMRTAFIEYLKNLGSNTFETLTNINDVDLDPRIAFEKSNIPVDNLVMHLSQMRSIIDSVTDRRAKRIWTNAMNEHIEDFYQKQVARGEFDVFELDCTTDLKNETLVGNVLSINYSLELSYKTFDELDPGDIAIEPFNANTTNDMDFIKLLQSVNNGEVFKFVTELRDAPGTEYPTFAPTQLQTQQLKVIIESTSIEQKRDWTKIILMLSPTVIGSVIIIVMTILHCLERRKKRQAGDNLAEDLSSFGDENENDFTEHSQPVPHTSDAARTLNNKDDYDEDDYDEDEYDDDDDEYEDESVEDDDSIEEVTNHHHQTEPNHWNNDDNVMDAEVEVITAEVTVAPNY
mmetsp:Transcript_62046/g.74647  ORF Transcript_62046/g.74647 Transcript_62046/m.74647 type:complete len:754 (-) Transcript_62046:410-2671(-)